MSGVRHFHVPLHWQGNEYLNATTQDWQVALKFAVETELCTHYEIETYTCPCPTARRIRCQQYRHMRDCRIRGGLAILFEQLKMRKSGFVGMSVGASCSSYIC